MESLSVGNDDFSQFQLDLSRRKEEIHFDFFFLQESSNSLQLSRVIHVEHELRQHTFFGIFF